MILGIGADILDIKRIRNGLKGDSEAFVQQTFTAKEQEETSGRPDPVSYYATRFAAKEAVFKCFGIAGDEVSLGEIEILDNDVGQPHVTLLGRAREIARQKGIRDVRVSLSYETDYAVAFAVAQDSKRHKTSKKIRSFRVIDLEAFIMFMKRSNKYGVKR
ncbi:MAG: holo-ACP synthase [Deltaproteobacteria bacterium]|nr:holo-ACP synthase [Deltaproteobacteria bacterium]